MSSTFRRNDIPDPPADLPANVKDYLRKLVLAVRGFQEEAERAFQDAEPVARLQVLGTLPSRSQDGDEAEFAAGVAGVSAGKYVYRRGAWVYIG
jgi:hypothetical protein